jgi:hypothetical protein
MNIQTTNTKAPVLYSVSPVATTVEQYSKFEAQLALTAAYTNPYDYDAIRISAIFTAPNNQTTAVEGFFMQDFVFSNLETGSLQATNEGVFKIRFSPTQPGIWRYQISCTTTGGTATFPEQTFECVASTNPGFVRRSESNYLQFDNQEQFIPVGENMCWQVSNGYLDYKKWLDQLSEHQGNFIRIWHAHWGLGIEWKNNVNGFQGLRRYKQSSAFYHDWLLDYCGEKRIYVMLCLQHHGQVSSSVNPNWQDSPYNSANGGPCKHPWEFFTNAIAKNQVKNRLRYIIARWGYATNIMGWELFNEIDWTDQFAQHKNDINNWLSEMAAFLKDQDPNKHLVTTSYAQAHNDPAVWQHPSIDFTQTHFYSNIPNLERPLVKLSRNYLADFQKPTLASEFGLGHSAAGLSTLDPTGIYIHNTLWASLFSGGLGAAMTWWWDNYIEPQNLYHHFAPITKMATQITFKNDCFQPATAIVKGAPASLQLFPTLGWSALADSNFSIDSQGVTSPDNAQLSSYLYGTQFNRQFRRPPVFKVNYPVNGKFTITTGARSSTRPKIAIWLDGVKKLEQRAAIHQPYSIDIPAGTRSIRVDNTGADWINIASYAFAGLGSAVDAYVLVSADRRQTAGWILNNKYNHDFIKNNGIPSIISSARVIVENVENGNYQVKWLDCASGEIVTTNAVLIQNNQLNLLVPNFLRALAFTLTDQINTIV